MPVLFFDILLTLLVAGAACAAVLACVGTLMVLLASWRLLR